jgi:hypothetical protein
VDTGVNSNYSFNSAKSGKTDNSSSPNIADTGENFSSKRVYMSLDGYDPSFLQKQKNITGSKRPKGRPKIPVYCYPDCPLVGWTKHVNISILGKNQGKTYVQFSPPNNLKRRIKNDNDLKSIKRSREEIPLHVFDFRRVFCVCHTPEDLNNNYIECSYGLTGCFGWIHPECVGLGPMDRSQILNMCPVICPFCVAYLTATDQLAEHSTESTLYVLLIIIFYLLIFNF